MGSSPISCFLFPALYLNNIFMKHHVKPDQRYSSGSLHCMKHCVVLTAKCSSSKPKEPLIASLVLKEKISGLLSRKGWLSCGQTFHPSYSVKYESILPSGINLLLL